MIVERRLSDGAAIRLLARPVTADGTKEVLVVGEPLAQRERALGALHALLAVGGPLALLIASVVGYALAAAALRPVERMRRHAAAVTAAGTSERLPVPPANDEIGRLGRTLNEMLARLEVSFKRERAFVSDASHELRTPLAILRTELELALRGEHTKQELEDALRSAAEESERLSHLAEDLLVIARSDQGRLPVRLETLDAGDVLARVAGALPDAGAGRGPPAGGRSVAGRGADRRPGPRRAGARQPRRQRAHLRRRHGGAQRPARPTAAWSCTCATRAPASRPSSCRGRSSASPAPTRRARAAAVAWGWRSRPRSPARTGAARRRTNIEGGADVWIACLHEFFS